MKESPSFPKYIQPLLLYLSKSKDLQNPEVYHLYVMVMVWGSTALLMWSYSLNSFFTIENVYGLTYLCFLYSIIHLLAPFCYKLYPSVLFCTYLFVVPGFIFQFHHAFATGGFYSNTNIWFSILPLIIGVILNAKHMIAWSGVMVLAVLALLFLTMNGYTYNAISPNGIIWSHLNIAVGYIFINLFLFLAYIKFRDEANLSIGNKKTQIQNLLRILVHDISNPLTLIKLSASQIKNSNEASQFAKQINYLDLGLQSIEEIISHVREYEALDSDKVVIELNKTDLNYAMSICLLVFDSKLKEKNIKVINKMDANLMVLAEKKMLLSQVLNNLMSNAIKFTHKGGTIELFTEQMEDVVRLHIEDNGVGISEKYVDKLFKESKCVSTTGTEGERGTGFGMPIVKMVMNKFQGKIEVKSSVDAEMHGTEFILSFKKFI